MSCSTSMRNGRRLGGDKKKMEYLKCDRCSMVYKDEESVRSVKKEAEGWKKLCERDGEVPRGLAPCPNITCSGELCLKE